MPENNAFVIDARRQEIRPVHIAHFLDISKFLECDCFCIAAKMPDRSVIYVDDEGFLKPQEHYFWMPRWRPDQPLAGNGVLAGPEIENADGSYYHAPPTITQQQIEAEVRFVPRALVVELLRARDAVSITTKTGTDVITTWDDLLESSRPEPKLNNKT